MKHIHFNLIDSTNLWAKNHVEHWASDGITLVTASGQTAGRGRLKRQWISPPSVNIYASFCFWIDDIQSKDFILIPQILALALSQILEKKGFSSAIKWPNDLLINNKKIAGILCESFLEENKRGVVCGIGLNVNMRQNHLRLIDRPATSLFVESNGQLFDINLILEELKIGFVSFLEIFFQKGYAHFYPLLIKKNFFKKGDNINFYLNNIAMQGKFLSLHPDGSIEILMPNGNKKYLYSE